jgi:hypothetical protein
MALGVDSMEAAPSTDCELIVVVEAEPGSLDTRLSQPGGGSTLVGISRRRLYSNEVSGCGLRPLEAGKTIQSTRLNQNLKTAMPVARFIRAPTRVTNRLYCM